MVNKNIEGAYLLLNMSTARSTSVPDISEDASGKEASVAPGKVGKRASSSVDETGFSSDTSTGKTEATEAAEVAQTSEPDSQVEMQEMISGRLLELMPGPAKDPRYKKDANQAPTAVKKTQNQEKGPVTGKAVVPPAGYSMRPHYSYMGYPPYVPYGYPYPVPFYPPPPHPGYPAPFPMFARPPVLPPVGQKAKDLSPGKLSKIVAKINGQAEESSDDEPASKKIKSVVKTGEKGFFIPRKSIPEISTGRRVVIYGYKPETTIEQVKECFNPCGNIVHAAFVDDSSIPDMKHAALVFEFENGASNAVQLAKIVDLPTLGGKVTAVLADDRFTLSGRLLRINFGQPIPFDDKAKTGLSVTFGKPLKLTQNGNLIELFYAKPQEAQKALTKAQQMRLNAQLV